MFLQDVAKII